MEEIPNPQPYGVYSSWNQRLVEFFFNEESCEKTIRLAIDDEILNRDFSDLGGSEGFRQALLDGPEWFGLSSLSGRLERLSLEWNFSRPRPAKYPRFRLQTEQEHRDPPPYLPYLAATCYAWTIEDPDLHANDFYSRFKLVIPEPLNDIGIHLGRFNYLWHELKKWANTSNGGRFGRFSPRPIGGHKHVGIPLAQVILPGRNRRRLGYLFRYVLGVPEDPTFPRELASEDLVRLLLGNEATSRWALGSVALRELDQGAGHARAILDHVNREIDEWNGEVEDRPPNIASQSGHANSKATPVLRVFSLLRPFRTTNGRVWRALATTMKPSGSLDGSVQLVHKENTYICQPGGDQLFRLIGHPEQILGVGPFLQGLIQQASFRDALDDEGLPNPVRLEACNSPVRFFITKGIDLLEIAAPPEDGPFFILPTTQRAADVWKEIARTLADNVQHIPGIKWLDDDASLNCPAGIWKVLDVSLLEEEKYDDWLNMLGVEATPSGLSSFAWLKGGTRVKGGGNPMAVYLASDPPQVVVNPPSGVLNWEALGAELHEVAGIFLQAGDEGNLQDKPWRHFDVLPKPPDSQTLQPSRIILSFHSVDPIRVKHLAFRVDWDGQMVPPVQGSGLAVDPFGNPATDGDRVSGCRAFLPAPSVDEPVKVTFKTRLARPFVPDAPGSSNDSGKLLAFLATRGKGCRRILYSHATKFMKSLVVEETSQVPSGMVHRDITLLRAMGHLEVEHDLAGRCNFIHALPVTMYMLPVHHCTGLFQSALSGTYTSGLLLKIQENAASCGVMVRSLAQLGGGASKFSGKFLPATILLLSVKVDSLSQLAEKVGIEWVPNPPALAVAEMSACLGGWQQAMLDHAWLTDQAPVGDEYLDPKTCTFVRRNVSGSPISGEDGLFLRRGIDSLTRKHKCYQLEKSRDGRPMRSTVRDKQWAIWTVVANYYGHGSIKVPYFPSIGGIELPHELDLPPLLSRALVLASGQAPYFCNRLHLATRDEGQQRGTFRGGGLVIRYHGVPLDLAQKVLGKVGAVLDLPSQA